MELYVFPPSPNCRKVLATVYHLGLPVDIRQLNLAAGEQRKPDFLAINPNGRVPALVDGDFRLWESNAIAQYLCEVAGDTRLWPGDARGRADVARWLSWQGAHWGPATNALIWENHAKAMYGMGGPDEKALADATEKFHAVARVLDAHLADRRFVAGDEPTIADFALGGNMTYAAPAKFPLEGYPNLRAWWDRLEDIDSWRRSKP
jgi:glutathione S-transferase